MADSEEQADLVPGAVPDEAADKAAAKEAAAKEKEAAAAEKAAAKEAAAAAKEAAAAEKTAAKEAAKEAAAVEKERLKSEKADAKAAAKAGKQAGRPGLGFTVTVGRQESVGIHPTVETVGVDPAYEPWSDSGELQEDYLTARFRKDAFLEEKDGVESLVSPLKHISVISSSNRDPGKDVLKVVTDIMGHEKDIYEKDKANANSDLEINTLLRPEEKITAELKVLVFNGFPKGVASDLDEQVFGDCVLALTETDDPAGPRRLVFMYKSFAKRTLVASGLEMIAEGCCPAKQARGSYKLTRENKAGLGLIQVQNQLVDIACSESTMTEITKKYAQVVPGGCCRSCKCPACCSLQVWCSCCEAQSLIWKVEAKTDDPEVLLQKMMGYKKSANGPAEAPLTGNAAAWKVDEAASKTSVVTLRWLDPVSARVKETSCVIHPSTPLQQVAKFVTMADFAKEYKPEKTLVPLKEMTKLERVQARRNNIGIQKMVR